MKSLNYLYKINYIVDIFCSIENINDDNEKINIKDKIFYYEEKILFYTAFNYEYDMPYNLLKTVMGNIPVGGAGGVFGDMDEYKLKKFKEKLSEIVNYSFFCPFFLYYDMPTISFSCLSLAIKKMNVNTKLVDIINIINNHKEMEYISIDLNDIEICSSLIDELVISKLNINFNIQPQIINNDINIINNINLQNNVTLINNSNTETKIKNDLNDDKKNNNINDKYKLLAKKRK